MPVISLIIHVSLWIYLVSVIGDYLSTNSESKYCDKHIRNSLDRLLFSAIVQNT